MICAVVLGSYRVDRLLGEGGMGAVYRAMSPQGHEIAVKVMHPHLLANPAMAARFRAEADNAAKVRNPHIAKVMTVATLPDGRTLIGLEFLHGNDLSKFMEHRLPILPVAALPFRVQLPPGLPRPHPAQPVIRHRIKRDHIQRRFQRGDEGQEELAVEAILVKTVRRQVGGGNQHHATCLLCLI